MAYFFIISNIPLFPHHFPPTQRFHPWMKYSFHNAEVIYICYFIEQVGIKHSLTLSLLQLPKPLTLLQRRFTLSTLSLLQHYMPPPVRRERCSEEAAQFNPTHTFNTLEQPPSIISPPVFDHQFIIRGVSSFGWEFSNLVRLKSKVCVAKDGNIMGKYTFEDGSLHRQRGVPSSHVFFLFVDFTCPWTFRKL